MDFGKKQWNRFEIIVNYLNEYTLYIGEFYEVN